MQISLQFDDFSLKIQILRKFQNFLSKTCWDTLELTLEAGISTVCPSSVCSKIHKQLPGSAQLIFVAEDPAPKFWTKSPLTCKSKIMGCLSNQTYGPGGCLSIMKKTKKSKKSTYDRRCICISRSRNKDGLTIFSFANHDSLIIFDYFRSGFVEQVEIFQLILN